MDISLSKARLQYLHTPHFDADSHVNFLDFPDLFRSSAANFPPIPPALQALAFRPRHSHFSVFPGREKLFTSHVRRHLSFAFAHPSCGVYIFICFLFFRIENIMENFPEGKWGGNKRGRGFRAEYGPVVFGKLVAEFQNDR